MSIQIGLMECSSIGIGGKAEYIGTVSSRYGMGTCGSSHLSAFILFY